jgi:hypothetical protein
MTAGGGKEPGVVARGFPVGAQQSEGICRQRDVAGLGTLSPVAMKLEALAIEIGNLEVESFMQPESQTVDSGQVDLMGEGCGSREETPDCCNPEDGREPVCGLRANE